MTINEELQFMRDEILQLKNKIADLSLNLEDKNISPYSKIGTGRDTTKNRPVEPRTGLGTDAGGILPWNDSELKNPPFNGTQPDTPTKGYNNHGHSRYSGGAFDISTIEFVDYTKNDDGYIIDPEGHVLNKHCQQFWKTLPKIEEDEKTVETGTIPVLKLGGIANSMVFDTTDSQWKFYAVYAEEEEV